MKDVVVNSLTEYLKEITSFQNNLNTFIYRGQCDKRWKVKSGVYRRIELSKGLPEDAVTGVEEKEVLAYLTAKLAEARKRLSPSQIADIHEVNDLNILVEMQHYGGATNLIDFSFNPLIALYFGASGSNDVDGKVFCINHSNEYKVLGTLPVPISELSGTPKYCVHSYLPNHSNKRIIKQDSVFIFNDLGFIDDSVIDFSLIIPASAKKQILDDLQNLAGITEESIYPDFLGYLQANNARKPFKVKTARDFFDTGYLYHRKLQFEAAIDQYHKSLELEPNQPKLIFLIAQCLRHLKRHTEALATCKKAVEIVPKDFNLWNELAINHTYLRNYLEAETSFEKAARLAKDDLEKRRQQTNIGWMYLCFGKIEKAIGILSPLMDDHKPYHPAINLGHCYFLLNDEEKAIENYRISITSAREESVFWKSFDSDYVAAQMEQNGISPTKYQEMKEKIKASLS